ASIKRHFQSVLPKERMNLLLDAALSLPRQCASINQDFAAIWNDVSLSAAANRTHIDRRPAQERMPASAQLLRVFGFQQVNYAGHRVHGISPQFRPSAVRRHPASSENHPKVTFVRGNNLETGWLANDRQVRSQSAASQGARAGLPIFLIHKTRKKNFSLRRP